MSRLETELREQPEAPAALAAQIELSLDEKPSLEEYRDATGLNVVARGLSYGHRVRRC